MLARAVDALVGFLFVQRRTVAGNLADVGEGAQQSEFGLDEFLVVARLTGAKLGVLLQEGTRAPCAHVVAGDQRAEFTEAREGLGAWVGVLVSGLGTELNARLGLGRRTLADLVEAQQSGARIDLAVDDGEDLANAPRGRCAQSGFHLHALQDHQRGTGLDLVADGHRHGDDHGRRPGADQAGLVLADAVS